MRIYCYSCCLARWMNPDTDFIQLFGSGRNLLSVHSGLTVSGFQFLVKALSQLNIFTWIGASSCSTSLGILSRLPHQGKAVRLLTEIGLDESASNQPVYPRLHPSGWGMYCGVTLSWKLIFCAGKLSDVLYVPPWRMLISVCESKGKSPLDCSPPTEYQAGGY